MDSWSPSLGPLLAGAPLFVCSLMVAWALESVKNKAEKTHVDNEKMIKNHAIKNNALEIEIKNNALENEIKNKDKAENLIENMIIKTKNEKVRHFQSMCNGWLLEK